jgi:hypothetical protein
MEKPRAQDASDDNPDPAIKDRVFAEALALSLPAGQPESDCDRRDEDYAVPAEGKMTDGEDDGVNTDGEHQLSLKME